MITHEGILYIHIKNFQKNLQQIFQKLFKNLSKNFKKISKKSKNLFHILDFFSNFFYFLEGFLRKKNFFFSQAIFKRLLIRFLLIIFLNVIFISYFLKCNSFYGNKNEVFPSLVLL